MKKHTVTVIGGGQMGRALVGGMVTSQFVEPASLTVIDPSSETRQWWETNHPKISVDAALSEASAGSDVILLAVKPNVIASVASQAGEFSDRPRLVISIAAGVSLETVCHSVGHQRVVRVMPNTPSLVRAGASAYCVASDVTAEDCQWLEEALSGVGVAFRVAESQMDAVTGVSGSGPAYICMVIEALADGGVLKGLPRELALQLAAQTVMGTAKMVIDTRRHPAELKDAVASPGGTTIAGIRALEENGLRAALISAVAASAERSQAMG